MTGPTKPARKPAAARSKAAAARAEKTTEPKTVDFRGITLTLPAVLPGSLYFDFAELEDDSGSIGGQVRLLDSLIGSDQVRQVRAKIAEDRVPFTDMETVLVGLFDTVLDAYGIGMGESSASAGS